MLEALRERCRKGVESKQEIWLWSKIQRNVSLGFVSLAIRLGVRDPDLATIASFGAGLFGCLLLGAGHLLLGFVCLQLYFIFDCMNGDIARYYNKANDFGTFTDRLVHIVVEPLMFLLAGNAVGNIWFGIIPAFCNQNGLRLIEWNFRVSLKKTFHEESHKQSFFEQLARFFSIYGFTLFVPFGIEALRVVLLAYSVWTPLACGVLLLRLSGGYFHAGVND